MAAYIICGHVFLLSTQNFYTVCSTITVNDVYHLVFNFGSGKGATYKTNYLSILIQL